MERRAFLELLAATPLASSARADTAFDPPPPPAYKVVTRFAPAAAARDAGTVPGPRGPHPLAARDGRRLVRRTRASCAR